MSSNQPGLGVPTEDESRKDSPPAMCPFKHLCWYKFPSILQTSTPDTTSAKRAYAQIIGKIQESGQPPFRVYVRAGFQHLRSEVMDEAIKTIRLCILCRAWLVVKSNPPSTWIVNRTITYGRDAGWIQVWPEIQPLEGTNQPES